MQEGTQLSLRSGVELLGAQILCLRRVLSHGLHGLPRSIGPVELLCYQKSVSPKEPHP
jgi:hypothetical protein